MKLIKLLFNILLLLSFSQISRSQQLGSNTQFMFNQFAINPAYTGIHQNIQLDLNVREQWVGFEGSPSTQQLSIHGAHKNRPVSFGTILVRDVIGLTSQYNLGVSAAYRIHLSYDNQLSFGIQTGLFAHQEDYSQTDLTDPTLAGSTGQFISPAIGVGMMWHAPNFYLGLGIPQVLNIQFNGTTDAIIASARHYYFTAGVIRQVNRQLHIKPNVMVKVVEAGSYQVDANFSVLLNKLLWLGITYSHNNSVNGLISYRVSTQLQVGYSYDLPFNSSLNGSHEVMLGYRFKRRRFERLKPIFF